MVDQEASTFLISFLQNYSKLVGEQLQSVRDTMGTTVQTVMEGIAGISQATGEGKAQAEKALESTFINPDAETEVLIQDMQKVVDELFDESSKEIEQGGDFSRLLTSEPEILVRNRFQRLTGKFENEIAALSSLDAQLSNMIFGIIGSLSSEDVIAQKLDHVIMSLKALQTGLNYVLIDYERRCNKEELVRVTEDIKDLTFRQYTTEDEKQRFHFYLGEQRKSS